MVTGGSAVLRRQLGRQLRCLREAAGKTERDVEEAKLASRAKLWRIESGKTAVRIADVRALCWLYQADHATTDVLASLAGNTTTQGWWEEYRDAIPDWFGLYVGLESNASRITIYDPELVHGLLQTPDYGRAVFRAVGYAGGDRERIERQIDLRRDRQQALLREQSPLQLTAVFGAGVLARPVGGSRVMADQVRRLRELNRLAHIEIRVLGWEVGAHAAMHGGAWTILDFTDPRDPAVVYLETHTGARYLERADELSKYRKTFDGIYRCSTALKEYQL